MQKELDLEIEVVHSPEAAVREIEGLTPEERTVVISPNKVVSTKSVELEIFVTACPGRNKRPMLRVLFIMTQTRSTEVIDWHALSIELVRDGFVTVVKVGPDDDDPKGGKAVVELHEGAYEIRRLILE